MQKESTGDSSDNNRIVCLGQPTANKNVSSVNDRKKRIKRMKIVIIIVVVILLLLPTVGCIILGLQVYHLQQQVNELSGLHSQMGLTYEEKEENYAYAAVKEQEELYVNGVLSAATSAIGTAGQSEDKEVQASDTSMVENNSLSAPKDDAGEPSDTNVLNLETKQLNNDKKDKLSSLSEGKYADKKIYLTFDDGPSVFTEDILDILSEYKVKATFFVVGKTDAYSKKMYQRIIDEGHTLGMHSYSHQYSKIYNSVEDFDKDFTKLWKLLYDTTGYKPSIFRFPGGSDNVMNKKNRDDIIRYLNKEDVVYFDWNVVNGDATGVVYTKKQLIKNVLDGINYKDNCIVLMHDAQAKENTVASLPGLLRSLLSEGAQLEPLSKDVTPIQMIQADKVQ